MRELENVKLMFVLNYLRQFETNFTNISYSCKRLMI